MLACGCKSQWAVETLQPPLVLEASQSARTSIPLAIVVRDMEMPRHIRLANVAYFVVVSRDRFRFRVSLQHKWDDVCDVRTWSVYVVDSKGQRHYPEHVDQRRVRPMYRGQRKALYRGTADFTIYRRDLYDAHEKVTLVMWRPGYEYRYTWVSARRE